MSPRPPRGLGWRCIRSSILATLGLMLLAAQGGSAALEQPTQAGSGIHVVVLDPGHGGADEGARGASGLAEKDVTLQVAQESMRLIAQLLGLQVVLTRSDDSAVPLEMRAARANQANGDLFISIHVGGSFGRAPHSFQTFYLDAPQRILLPGRDDPKAGSPLIRRGPTPRGATPQPRALPWDQAQWEFLDRSQVFARTLQKNLRTQIGDEERDTQGLPLLVLRWVRMPAVLLDLGSLSDPTFEDRLRDDAYVQRAALGIAQAVNDYQNLSR